MKVQQKIDQIKKKLHNSVDVADRKIVKNDVEIGFIYLKSMTDNVIFSQSIFEPILLCKQKLTFEILMQTVEPNDVVIIQEDEIYEKVLKGCVVIFLSNSNKYLAVDILKFNTRIPSEPPTSSVIMGPREGFTEDIKTNITLLRRRFYSDKLVFETLSVGTCTKTQIMLAYLDGIVDKKILKEGWVTQKNQIYSVQKF